jgi:nuclease-like protein
MVRSPAERRTARALRRLGRRGWTVRDDLSGPRGDRHHVLVGPRGVFLVDTDRADGGAGRPRRLRALAAALADALGHAAGHRHRVTPVVLVHGSDAPPSERDGVWRVGAGDLEAWLGDRPGRISATRRGGLVTAIRDLPAGALAYRDPAQRVAAASARSSSTRSWSASERWRGTRASLQRPSASSVRPRL